jgi:hypothetical protein
LDEDNFRDPIHRHIFSILIGTADATIDEISAGMDERATEVFQELLTGGQGLNHDAIVRGGIASLLAREAYDEGSLIQQALEFAIQQTRLDDVRARTAKEIVNLWKRVGLGASDSDHLTIDSLIAKATELFDRRVRGAKEWLKLKVQKWKAAPYPTPDAVTDFIQSFNPWPESDASVFGGAAAMAS